MKVLFYSAYDYEEHLLRNFGGQNHELVFTRKGLTVDTASLADGFDAVSLSTSDGAGDKVLEILRAHGVRLIVLRSVSHNHVDLGVAADIGIRVANVPEYSAHEIAEHAVAMMMAVSRKLSESRISTQLSNLQHDSSAGFDVQDKTVGIIGGTEMGVAFSSIMKKLKARILVPASLSQVLKESDILFVHCPLTNTTSNLLGRDQFRQMKNGSMLVSAARGGVVRTTHLIDFIESGKLKCVCLDVYENMRSSFFEDHRDDLFRDPLFARMRNFKNVLSTGHPAFFRNEEMAGIAKVTIANLDCWEQTRRSPNELFTGRIMSAPLNLSTPTFKKPD